ncbi:MAG: EAL domain-containing protein, partial [Gammaproteobacteria bacterium]|nr:EAL domain-containing protein [Gammaproteobacteria bacterium]
DGKLILVDITYSPAPRDGRMLVLDVGRDLSRSMRSRQQIELLNRVLWVLSNTNRAITREHTEEALFRRICEIAIASGQFRFASVALVDQDRVLPLCDQGVEGCAFTPEPMDLNDSLVRETPFAVAVNSGRIAIENRIASADALRPWKEALCRQGLQALVVLPVMHQQNVVALLTLYSASRDAYADGLLEILTNLQEDLSWAVRSYRAERDRQAASQHIRLLSSALEQSSDAISMIDLNGLIRYVNPRFMALTGFAERDVLGRSPRALCFDDEEAQRFDKVFVDLREGRQWRGEFKRRKSSGEQYWSMETISPIRDEHGAVIQYVSSAEDVTALRKAQSKIEQLAFFDPLTGLANRRLLHERMRGYLAAAERQQHSMAVMLLDLDRFKTVNESGGHQQGDELLKTVAQRLLAVAGPDATVARLGGDEFAVVLGGIDQHRDVAFLAERILERMREPIQLAGIAFEPSASMGIALYPMDAIDIHDLLRCADMAMYHAKSLGRNNFQFFTAEINSSALAQIALEQRLRDAVRDGHLEPFYQPIWDSMGQVLGFEALIRWRDPIEGLISPGVFVPLAEQVGLIEAIGELVIRRACADISQIRQAMQRDLFISVNLSPVQFRRPDRLLAVLEEVLTETGLPPGKFELELTESMLINDVDDALELMARIRALGIRLVIDDFGTGYSSLNYLSCFPVDKLKIDRSFVVDIEGPRGRAIASAIIALGNRLGMKVVAEGVETDQQRQILRAQGCDQFQGFLVSRPLPLDDVKRFLTLPSMVE